MSLEKKFVKLSKYSDRYEISVQMWPLQWAVYIAKDDVDLTSFGGEPEETLQHAIDYLNRINKVPHEQSRT